MNTYKFQASTTAGQWVLEGLQESLAIIPDAHIEFSGNEEILGVSTCVIKITSEYPVDKLQSLFDDLCVTAHEAGIRLCILHSPDRKEFNSNLTVVLKATKSDPLQDLLDSIPLINKMMTDFQVRPSVISETLEGDILILDIPYDSSRITKEFFDGYFKDCCNSYGISYSLYDGGTIC